MVDTSEPFLAFLPPDKPNNAPIALVNPTDVELRDVVVKTGGQYTDDELGVIEANAKAKVFDLVPARGFIIIEQPDKEELSEFVIWWTVTYTGREDPLKFSLFKGRGTVAGKDVPVLGGSRALIKRESK